MADPTAADFIGWGKLQERMFEPFDTTASAVVGNLLTQAEVRFADLEEPELERAVRAFVEYYAWQGLADARDLDPATERQGGRTDQYSESQLALYRTKAAAAKAALERYLTPLDDSGGFDFGPLYGGSDVPAAFRRYECLPEGRDSARPQD